MQIRFNRTGAERKALVAAMGEVLEVKPMYMGAPGFAYSVGAYTVDKDGTLESGDGAEIFPLLEALAQRGFVPEETPEPMGENAGGGQQTAAAGAMEASDSVCTGDVLSIELPAEGLHGTAAENLKRLIAGKAPLIRAALGDSLANGADALPVDFADGKVRFPWFQPGMDAEALNAWSRFVIALCEAAKKQKRVIMTEKSCDGSEKYAMRCFLLKLGFIGEEYKAMRRAILSHLSGSGSFKSGDGKKPRPEQPAATQGDCLSCGQSMSEPGEAETGPERLFYAERREYVSEDGFCPEYN